MNIWNILKAWFALAFIFNFAMFTLALSLFEPLSLFLFPYLGPMWLGLGFFALPIFLFISLKLLAWIDLGLHEFGINIKARARFVRLRHNLVKNLPKWLGELVEILT